MVMAAQRIERVRDAQRLRAGGRTVSQIAERFGVSRSTASSWLSDPDLSKQRARRRRYAGRCHTCGRPTDGSNGRAAAPRFCLDCYPDAHRMWTREAVIGAIQAWAAEHGEPPTTTDWINAQNGYPAASSIHSWSNAPFRQWADAIEAAGFPRPLIGKYERVGLRGAGRLERQILAELVAAGNPMRCRDFASPTKEHGRYTVTWYALQGLVRRGLVEKDGDYYTSLLAAQPAQTAGQA